MKITAEKGTAVEFSILVKTDAGRTEITSYTNDLIEENGLALIPSTKIAVEPVRETIANTEFRRFIYKIQMPSDQKPGLYTGKIIILN